MSNSRVRPGICSVPEQGKVVLTMVDAYLHGNGLQAICDRLMQDGIPSPNGNRVWHPAVVSRILHNPLHAGLIPHNGEYTKGAHYEQRLYDPEVFYQILEIRKSRFRAPRRTLACPKATLASVARCDECGSRMRIVPVNQRYRAYRCDGPRMWGTQCTSRPRIRGDHLEPRVAQEIEKIATSPKVLEAAEAEVRSLLAKQTDGNRGEDVEKLRAELADVQRRWETLARSYATGSISEELLNAGDTELRGLKTHIERRLAELEQAEPYSREAHCSHALEALRSFPKLWEAMEVEEQKTVFELLIESLRIGRTDHAVHVKLKLRFLDEVAFDLPIHHYRGSAHRRPCQTPISPRQLAYLALVQDGYSNEQIARRWKVTRGSVNAMCNKALSNVGVSTVQEAIARFQRELSEWRRLLPLDGRYGKPLKQNSLLSKDEMFVLKGMAAGKSDEEIAAEQQLPATTISGRRNRVREKLEAKRSGGAVAKAISLGILRPEDPSPAMLLNVYEHLRAVSADEVARLKVRRPTPRQMECLKTFAEGLTIKQAAQRLGTGLNAIVHLRQRTWLVVGASSYREALERVQQLGLAA